MMTCRHVQQMHDSFLDGDLSASLTAEVHAHLLQCPACQHQMEISRASADVIAKDHAQFELDSGFAMRVVAALPKPAMTSSPQNANRLRRRQVWRLVGMAVLPAAAAVLFLSVVILPPAQTTPRPTLVAGKAVEAAGVKDIMNPTLDAVAGTRQAAQDLNRVLQLSVRQAGEDVRQGLQETRPALGDPSLIEVLLQPFNDVLRADQPQKPSDPTVVRF